MVIIIKVPLSAIVKSASAVQNLTSHKINARDAFKLLSVVETVNKETEKFYTVKDSLLEKYGEQDSTTKKYFIPASNEDGLNKANEELELLWNTEIELNIEPFKFEVFENSSTPISAIELGLVKYLFEQQVTQQG